MIDAQCQRLAQHGYSDVAISWGAKNPRTCQLHRAITKTVNGFCTESKCVAAHRTLPCNKTD